MAADWRARLLKESMRYLWPALFIVTLLGLAVVPSLLKRDEGYDEELVMLSPHWDGIRSEFSRAFREHYLKKTGKRIRLVWLDFGGSGEVTKYVRERFKQVKDEKGGIGADIFFGGGMDNLPGLASENSFEPVKLPAELESKIPAAVRGQPLRDEQNRFHAACLSGFGFVYNEKIVVEAKLPEPRKWSDLGRPEYHGWITSGDPSLTGSVQQAFEIVLQAEGWERGFGTLTKMLGNARAFNEGGPSVPRDVSLGQAAAGPCIDFYATAPLRRNGVEHLKFVLPECAAVVTPDGIALMRGAPHRAAALEFIYFVLGEEGQKLWYLKRDPDGKNGAPVSYDLERLPVMPSIYEHGWPTNTVLNPFKTSGDSQYDSKKAGTRWSLVKHMMRAVWVDAHEELWDVREAVIKAGASEKVEAMWNVPPISENELIELAKKKPTPDQINELKNKWTSWARERYGEIARAARGGSSN